MASLSQQPEHGGWSERAAGDWCGTELRVTGVALQLTGILVATWRGYRCDCTEYSIS